MGLVKQSAVILALLGVIFIGAGVVIESESSLHHMQDEKKWGVGFVLLGGVLVFIAAIALKLSYLMEGGGVIAVSLLNVVGPMVIRDMDCNNVGIPLMDAENSVLEHRILD